MVADAGAGEVPVGPALVPVLSLFPDWLPAPTYGGWRLEVIG